MMQRRGFIAAGTVWLLSSTLAAAQEPIKVTDTVDFFNQVKSAKVPQKTDFETKEQFEARKKTESAWSGGTVYIVVAPLHNEAEKNRYQMVLDKPYQYDLKSQKLTIRGGGRGPYMGFDGHLKGEKENSVGVLSTVSQIDYTGTNGFGARVDVDGFTLLQYTIRLAKTDGLPLDKYNRFAFELPGIPPQEAQAQAEDYNVIVGVVPSKIDGIRTVRFTAKKPEFKSPFRIDAAFVFVDVEVQEVLLQRKSTGEIVKRVTAKK